MKRKIIALVFAPILLFTSCEEDVILDLGKIQKKLVIEANISNIDPFAKVVLSYSQGFYDTLSFSKISNAEVEIISESGEREQLLWKPKGYYYSQHLKPEFGKKYTLKVIADNKTVEVTTTLPSPVKIKQIIQVPNPFKDSKDTINLFVNVDDPKGEDDYFRLKVFKIRGKSGDNYYFMDDSFGKDGVISMPVYYKNFVAGDTAVVELMHTTRETYDYYNSLNENVRGSFNSIAPGNPVSNMPDDVYGYFAAYGIERDTVIIRALPF